MQWLMLQQEKAEDFVIASEMIREDLKTASRDELVKKHGYPTYDYHE